MSYQTEELKAGKPSAAAEWKDVKSSVYWSVQTLKSSVEYAQRWMEEDRSGLT